MANQTKPETVTEPRAAVEDTEAKDTEVKFPQDRLIADAYAITGHTPFEVAGALSGVTQKELTATQAKAAVAKWLKAGTN